MAKFNLCTIRPKGFLHASAFDDVKSSLAWALSALGHEVLLTENTFSASASTNIIFGAELLSARVTPTDSILYNMEQPSHPSLAPNGAIISLAWGHRVWDFSARNVARWRDMGLDAIHVPIGYTPNLTRIPKAPVQDIDVCFMGWMTPRRLRLLADLRTAGLTVFASDACYGGARDNILSRSKVVLNVHHDGRDMFEIVRVSYLLANSKFVVSEMSSDESDYSWADGVCVSSYDNLVSNCMIALSLGNREDGASRAFHAFSQQDYVATVSRALDASGTSVTAPAAPSVSPIQARYDRGCLEGDMRAFLPWLREHAKGLILEIGVRDGASTSAFLLGLEANGGHLTSIDIHDRSGLWQHPPWTFHLANSLRVEFPDSTFDVALIDGDHSAPAFLGDLHNCYHWVRPGGLVLSHDLKPERGHEFYSILLRREWLNFVGGDNPSGHPLDHYELPGPHGMGVFTVPEAR